MWNTLFAIAIAASVWFSAASLAVEFDKQRSSFLAALDKPAGEQNYRQATSANAGDDRQLVSHLD